MTMISRLGLGQRGFYFGLGLAVGLGFAVHGAAASSVSTPCRNGSAATSKRPASAHVAPATQQARVFVSGRHRWKLTLERVVTTAQIQSSFGTYHAHGKYIVVFLLAQNLGTRPQYLSVDQDFALGDQQGREFGLASSDANVAASEYYKTGTHLYLDDVQPTFSARFAFVFDVARDARGLSLVNAPSFGDTTHKLFPLGI